jgi:hypothetical protein
MAQQLTRHDSGSRIHALPLVVAVFAGLALCALPVAALAQGAPSNAVDVGGSFAGAQSPRVGGESADRPWSATLRAFADYDSNIGLTEENAPFPFEPEGALRAGLGGAGSYRVLDGESFSAGVGGFFTQTVTAGDAFADEYDLTTLAPQLWANARFSAGAMPGFAQVAYEFRRDWLEGGDFERSHTVRARAAVRPRETLELESYYAISFDTFDATGFHALDDRRDADHHRVGLAATWLRPERGQSLSFGYEYLNNHAENDDFDFTGHGFRARFRTPLAQRMFLELLAAYTSADYIHYPTSPAREARTQSYRARLLVPLGERLAADVGYGHLRIGADQARFRAKRNVASFGLSYLF